MRRKNTFPRWLVLSLALAWIGLATLPATAQTVLQWKFKPGEKLHYQTRQKIQSIADQMGQEIKTDTDVTMDVLWEVKTIDAEGVATIEQKLVRVRFRSDNPMMSFEWDSSDGKEPEGLMAMAVKPMKGMINKPSTLKMNPFGKILEVKPSKEMAQALKEATGPMGQGSGLNEDSLKSMVGQGIVFPEKGLTEGQKWNHATSMKTPIGNTRMDSTYEFLGMEQKSGRSLARIAITPKIQIEPSEESMIEVEVSESTGKGMCWFDPQRGVIVLTEMKTETTMNMSMMGQSMEQKMTQHNVMTLLEEQAGKDKADKKDQPEAEKAPKEKTAEPPAPMK